jgi:glycosyltransferase involved in cell wall biosynthesis
MQILFLTQWFQPEPNFKGLPFAKALQKRGHEVEVLTGFPNYPSGRLYPGYKVTLIKKEKLEGVPVIRTFLYSSHNDNKIMRFLNYISFAFSAAFVGSVSIKKPDIIYAYHPPATIMLPAFIIKLIYKAPIVLDIQDLWPDTIPSTNMLRNKIVIKLLDLICRLFYRLADKIIVLSPGFRGVLVKRGVPKDKIKIIHNWCDEDNMLKNNIKFKVKRRPWPEDKYNVLYAGNLGKAQALSSVLKAAQILKRRDPEVQIIFIGDGIESKYLVQLAGELDLNNVLFLPQMRPSEIGPYLISADALLVHLRDDPLFSITIPSKTQAYLAAGRPIIMAVKGDAAEIIKKSGAGICCEPESPESIADAILNLKKSNKEALQKMGENGLNYYLNNFSFNVGIKSFEKVFYDVFLSSAKNLIIDE